MNKTILSLIKKAKKYNSAEEFVNSILDPPKIKNDPAEDEIITLYHGTSKKNAASIKRKRVIKLGTKDVDIPDKVFLTTNLERAREFGDEVIEVRLRYGDKNLIDLDGLDLIYNKPLKIIPYTKSRLINIWKRANKDKLPKLVSPLPPFEAFLDWEGVKDEGDFASFAVNKKTTELIGHELVDTEDTATITINRNEYEAARKNPTQFKSLIKSKLQKI